MKSKSIIVCLLFLVSVLIGCGQEQVNNSYQSDGNDVGTEVNGEEGGETDEAGDGDQIEERSLRLSHVASTEDDTHFAAEFYADRVEELSDGKITIDIYPNNQLGTPEEVAEQVQMGTVDMAIASSGQVQLWVPEFAAIQLPFLFDGVEHVYSILDGEGGEILAELAREQDFEVLSHWELGFRVISNNKRLIETPEDMEGLQIRVPPELPMEAAMRALGAVPEQISWPEVYMSLSQGVVDGQENPLHYIYNNSLHEVQDYITVTGEGYMYASFPHIMNLDLWESLSEKEREILKQASEEARDLNRESVAQTMDDAVEAMEAEGVQINYPDPEPFREAMDPAWEEIAEYAGEEFVEQWLELVEEAR